MLSINSKDYIPQRVGLQYSPPTIILEYYIPSQQKVYRHKIKLLRLTNKSNVREFVDYIKKRHYSYVQNNKVQDEQLETLVMRLKDKLNVSSIQKSEQLADSQKFKSNDTQQKKKICFDDEKIHVEANVFEEIEDEPEYEDDFDPQSSQSEYNNSVNLNQLSPEEVQLHKQKMDVKFNKNRLKPGDPGFQYDKQAVFKPTKDSEWDDD